MPTNDPRQTKAGKRDAARERAAQLRAEQERKAKRTRIVAIVALVAAVLVLGGVGYWIVSEKNATAEAYGNVTYGGTEQNLYVPSPADVDAPSTADDKAGIPVSSDGVGKAVEGDTTVDIYFDFMCPYCGQFDAAQSADLEAMAGEQGVTITYHPVSILDRLSLGTAYSTRTANALAVVADQDPEHMLAFMTALFENQPEENTKGLTDAEIATIAQDAGVPADVTAKFTAVVDGTYQVTGDDGTPRDGGTGTWRTFAPWVLAATQQASNDLANKGGLSTPTVLIDGTKWTGDLYTPGTLKAAVEAAKG